MDGNANSQVHHGKKSSAPATRWMKNAVNVNQSKATQIRFRSHFSSGVRVLRVIGVVAGAGKDPVTDEFRGVGSFDDSTCVPVSQAAKFPTGLVKIVRHHQEHHARRDRRRAPGAEVRHHHRRSALRPGRAHFGAEGFLAGPHILATARDGVGLRAFVECG